MFTRNALALVTALLLAAPAGAESFSGSISFDGGANGIVGELWFTALDPGETSSGVSVFSGYTQTATSDYTYLYYLENDSATGTTVGACDTHCFIGLDLETLVDPTTSAITAVGFDSGNSGEAPSFLDTISPDIITFEFDGSPNEGIPSAGGFSAWLVVHSAKAPNAGGGAWVTNDNFASGDDFVYLSSGVTTPVPEPTTGALLALGLAAMAARRRR